VNGSAYRPYALLSALALCCVVATAPLYSAFESWGYLARVVVVVGIIFGTFAFGWRRQRAAEATAVAALLAGAATVALGGTAARQGLASGWPELLSVPIPAPTSGVFLAVPLAMGAIAALGALGSLVATKSVGVALIAPTVQFVAAYALSVGGVVPNGAALGYTGCVVAALAVAHAPRTRLLQISGTGVLCLAVVAVMVHAPRRSPAAGIPRALLLFLGALLVVSVIVVGSWHPRADVRRRRERAELRDLTTAELVARSEEHLGVMAAAAGTPSADVVVPAVGENIVVPAIDHAPPATDTDSLEHIVDLRRTARLADRRVFIANDADRMETVGVILYDAATLDADAHGRASEARALAADDDHLVGIRQVGTAGGNALVLVTEALPNQSLGQQIRSDRFEGDPAGAIALGNECCIALAAFHRAGHVHGDVQPDNIWITEQGHVLLGPIALSRSGAIGANPFAAPEARDGSTLDSRADVYSIARVIGAVATGRVPRNAAFPTPESVLGPLAHVRALQRALDPDPERRPPSATALWEELQSLTFEESDYPARP